MGRHQLADLCALIGTRLIHVSTDCVFSGKKGNYTESDTPDATDLYGRSKVLGEPRRDTCLTLRTSMIGRQLNRRDSLLEWFLFCKEPRIRGFTHAIFTGFPTGVLAEILCDIVENHESLDGLYHVSSKPISKYELLCRLRDGFGKRIEIASFNGALSPTLRMAAVMGGFTALDEIADELKM